MISAGVVQPRSSGSLQRRGALVADDGETWDSSRGHLGQRLGAFCDHSERGLEARHIFRAFWRPLASDYKPVKVRHHVGEELLGLGKGV